MLKYYTLHREKKELKKNVKCPKSKLFRICLKESLNRGKKDKEKPFFVTAIRLKPYLYSACCMRQIHPYELPPIRRNAEVKISLCLPLFMGVPQLGALVQ
jgi:hypothetical protein